MTRFTPPSGNEASRSQEPRPVTELPEAVVLEGGREDLGTLRAFVVRACSAAGVSQADAFALRLAAEEAFINVITHGYDASAEARPVEVRAQTIEDAFALTLTDRGAPFDPGAVPPADLRSDWDERPVGGVGWHLIGELMDAVRYAPETPQGNRLTLVKRMAAPSASSSAAGLPSNEPTE